MKNRTFKIKNNFVKGILVLAGGTAISQILNTLFTPIVTRIYSPEEYGNLTVYAAILGLLAIIGSLKYEWAIAITDDDEKAINLLALSISVLVIFVGIITIIISLWGGGFLSLFSGTEILRYKYLIPLGIFFAGLYNIFTQWAIRRKSYSSISKTKLNQSISQNATKIGLGLLHLGPIGLILGSIVGQSAGIMTLSKPLLKNDRNLIRKINLSKIRMCAIRYIKFPIYSASSQFLNTAGLQLPIIFITSVYGQSAIGLYGLASTIVNIPMNLIGRSVSDVFYGEAASIGKKDPKKVKQLSLKLFKKLLLIGLIPLLILLLFGPFLFSLVFGQSWYESGVLSRIIAVLVFTRFIFTPTSRIFAIYERQREELLLDIFRLIVVVLVFGLAKFLYLNLYWAVGLYTLGMSIIYLITFLLANKILSEEIKGI